MAQRKTVGDDIVLPESLMWLDKYRESGVTWTIKDVPVNSVLLDRAKQYQARMEQFYPDVVSRYSLAMKGGAKFPPVVLVKTGTVSYEVIDGVHRTLACVESERKHVLAVVLDPVDHEVRVAMVAECNSIHGVPYNTAERILHGMMLVDNGFTHIRAAEVVGIGPNRISEAINHRIADKRARSLGIEGWGKMTPTFRRIIQRIHDDTVFEALAKFCLKATVTGTELNEIVIEINAKRTVEGGMAVIEDWRKRLGIRASVKTSDGRKVPARGRLMAGMVTIERLIETIDLSPGDVHRMREVALKMLDKADAYEKEHA